MISATEFVFWLSVAAVVYLYLGYPATLLLVRARRGAPPRHDGRLPSVTILIAAYNEARDIGATLTNKLDLDYPRERLQIVVVSDGSTDGTDEIVSGYASRGVSLIRQEPRQGKTAALNLGRTVATGELVVFSDANSRYDRQALRHLVDAFEDPEVGYATGLLMYLNPGESPSGASCGLYMRYENWVRRLETRVGSIVGVNGGIDAVRRRLFEPMRPDHLPDFVLPLRVVEQGFRVVFCPAAVSYEEALPDARDEFGMRVRVSLRSLRTLCEMRHLLSPAGGFYAFQLWAHKGLRYLVFVPLIAALVANLMLAGRGHYLLLLALQVAFYGAAAVGLAAQGRPWAKALGIPAFFVIANAAAAVAVARFLRGDRQTLWQPRKGA